MRRWEAGSGQGLLTGLSVACLAYWQEKNKGPGLLVTGHRTGAQSGSNYTKPAYSLDYSIVGREYERGLIVEEAKRNSEEFAEELLNNLLGLIDRIGIDRAQGGCLQYCLQAGGFEEAEINDLSETIIKIYQAREKMKGVNEQ